MVHVPSCYGNSLICHQIVYVVLSIISFMISLLFRYRDRLYYLSSEEAKEKFVADPLRYTAKDQKPIKVND